MYRRSVRFRRIKRRRRRVIADSISRTKQEWLPHYRMRRHAKPQEVSFSGSSLTLVMALSCKLCAWVIFSQNEKGHPDSNGGAVTTADYLPLAVIIGQQPLTSYFRRCGCTNRVVSSSGVSWRHHTTSQYQRAEKNKLLLVLRCMSWHRRVSVDMTPYFHRFYLSNQM